MPDYIPNPDADFDNWQDNFVTYANAHLVALGLVGGWPDRATTFTESSE